VAWASFAGDHLKSASDLGLPLIAVGLYYRFGYFRQSWRLTAGSMKPIRSASTQHRIVGVIA